MRTRRSVEKYEKVINKGGTRGSTIRYKKKKKKKFDEDIRERR